MSAVLPPTGRTDDAPAATRQGDRAPSNASKPARARRPTADAPLFSEQWFRVSTLQPRLDPSVCASRITWRGQVWHVLAKPSGQRSLRLNDAAYAFAGRCDGVLTVQALWELVVGEFGDHAPGQQEMLQLLVQLKGAGMLVFDRATGGGPWALRGLGAVTERKKAPAKTSSILSIRMPLGSPDALLARLAPVTDRLFGRTGLAAWCVVVAFAGLAALLNLDSLVAHATLWTTTPRYLLLAWLLYPLVKAVHELAHGAAIRRFGGAVPEWGITWMMFSPVPYVDASAASAFPRASRRFLVSAAGIMAELFLAALALFVGLSIEPGWTRDIAFVVFGIGCVSTLLVNGNPLLRFDGYHALTDALELPNLDTRSRRWWLQRLQARVLRAPVADPLQPARGERPWLWAYAPASLAWRVSIALALVFWAGKLSVMLGSALALYFVGTLVLQPALRGVKLLAGDTLAVTERRRARRIVGIGGAVLVFAACAVPLPDTTLAQGVVWPPADSRVVAGAAGFVEAVLARDGDRVTAGQLLVRLSAPQLEVERAALAEQIVSLESERYQSMRADPARSAAIEQSLVQARRDAARVDEKIDALDVRAQVAGVLALPKARDLPGRHLKQGDFVAQVMTGDDTVVRVAIPQEDAARVRASLDGSQASAIRVRLADDTGPGHAARLVRDLFGAGSTLPSAALSEQSGGSIQTDPKDVHHLKPVDGVVLADVVLPAQAGARLGTRAWVRIDHGATPLVVQLARRGQQLFLKHFDTQ